MKVSVNCGDWGQSWGLSTNAVGKLSTEDQKEYTWKGHSQGRHGNKWNKGSEFIFKLNNGVVEEVSSKGTRPNNKALHDGIFDLTTKIEAKVKRSSVIKNKKAAFNGADQLKLKI